MYFKLFKGGNVTPSDVKASHHYPASNTAAVVTLSAVADHRHHLHKIFFSYDADPTAGGITITDGGTTVFSQAITKSGPGAFTFSPRVLSNNSAVVITLAAGAVVGKVDVEYTTEKDS